jgi:hypothetical protein
MELIKRIEELIEEIEKSKNEKFNEAIGNVPPSSAEFFWR